MENVDFDVKPGEVLGVVGESGCGKSLTLLSLTGLLPNGLATASGTLRLSGDEYDLTDPAALRQLRGSRLGMIFQEPIPSLDPAFRIGDQLAEVVKTHRQCSRADARARVVELLSMVSLDSPGELSRRFPHELSGGMAQRVAIARGLAGDPSVLLADEPTTALDVSVQAEILGLLREISAAASVGIVLVTHDWGVVADICDRAVVLYAGSVVEEAPVSELWHQPHHPYTADLIAANPHFAKPGVRLPTIGGHVPAPGSRRAGCVYAPRCNYQSEDCQIGRVALVPVGRPADSSRRLTRCLHPDRVSTGES